MLTYTHYFKTIRNSLGLFLYYIFKTWCACYTHSTSQFILTTPQVIKSHMWLVPTVADSAGNLHPDFLIFCALDLCCLFSFVLCCHADLPHSDRSGFFFSLCIWQIITFCCGCSCIYLLTPTPPIGDYLMILFVSML